jgi:DNA polymerase-3 subunit alpha (Gram-positive type)
MEKQAIKNIRLKKIAMKKEQKELLFYFTCTELPTPKEFLHIEQIAAESAASFAYQILYEYENGSKILENTKVLKRYIEDITRFAKPFLVPVIENGRMETQEQLLTLLIPDEHCVDILRFSKFNVFIEEYFLRNLNTEIRIKYQIDGQLKSDVCAPLKIEEFEKQKEELQPEKRVVFVPKETKQPAPEKKEESKQKAGNVITGKKITSVRTHISMIDAETGECTVEGRLLSVDARDTKDGKKKIINFSITDGTSSIQCKFFCGSVEKGNEIVSRLEKQKHYKVQGEAKFDTYLREVCVSVKSINTAETAVRKDEAPQKRVELHLHTVMSAQDSTVGIKDIIKKAIAWGHEAIAITDHGVVQAFPDAESAARDDIKVIYGMEAYVVDDTKKIVTGADNHVFSDEYIVFDIETTGLQPATEGITEIGAVKISNQEVVDTFSTFVNPGKHIPINITKLTGINDDMVKDAPDTKTALSLFAEFAKDACLVAHNASFDTGFVFRKGKENGITYKNSVIDTLSLCKRIYPGLHSYSLNNIAEHLGLKLHHHRAQNDAECTASIFLDCMRLMSEMGMDDFSRIDEHAGANVNTRDTETHHAIILCKNRQGLQNLYRLVSESHLNYFYRRPRIPKSLLESHREGLIIGSACEQGELFKVILKKADEDTLIKTAMFYDYLELQPKGNNAFLLREGILKSEKELDEIYYKIIELGERLNKPVVATCDVHFIEEQDEYFRRILMSMQKFDDADLQAPLYFRTTEEMLAEFAFLGEETALKIVVDNTQLLASRIEKLKLLPKEPAMPKIEGADEEIRRMAIERAKQIYGDPMPQLVEKRLDRELTAIITHGFAVLYFIAHKLVKKSLEDGYLVGSRGSVGSSFVAFTTGITEVNPLEPHYVCLNCKYSEFGMDTTVYECGIDLPPKNCPQCGNPLKTDGYNIPFEVFLGINADKVPDIDLNFSGDYQPQAHKFTEELFGSRFVFRAGTISSIQEKTAFGFVKAYMEEKGLTASKAEIQRLADGISGVKRTTGQHPGGLVVVPQDRDIHEFTPVQRPANDTKSTTVTTHFDFNSLHDTLVKLDILGHDDPTALKMLHDLTGVDPKKIPLNDAATISLFCSPEALGIKPGQIPNCETGTIAIPEFGTRFVRQMLVETKPNTMTELIRICGLSHGTDVWLNNAQELIKNGTATLSKVICTRDDIMNYLVSKGVEQRLAFFTMENVRKGKGLKEDMEKAMHEHHVPQWFIDSCKKIKYMFPKAHSAAYVIMAFRVAYYKVHYPREFYAAYFTVRADNFSAQYVMDGPAGVKKHIAAIDVLGNNANALQKAQLTILEVVLEMFERGISFLPIDLAKSQAKTFVVEGDYLRLPFIAVENLGENAADNITKARDEAAFISVEDIKTRARLSSAAIEKLKGYGCLINMTLSNQVNFFD